MNNLTFTLIVIAIVALRALEQGFRIKRDHHTPGKKYDLYNLIHHAFVCIYDGFWGSMLWVAYEYHPDFNYPSVQAIIVYFVMLRFGIYSFIINLCNLDHWKWNHVREAQWTFKLWSKIFARQYPVNTLWFFRFLSTIIALLYFLIY